MILAEQKYSLPLNFANSVYKKAPYKTTKILLPTRKTATIGYNS